MKGITCTGGRCRQALAVLVVLGLTASRAAAAPYFYTITDLGVGLGPHSEAVALNDAGQVVGESSLRPFLLGGGSRTDIGGGAYAATGINNAGQIVGDRARDNESRHGYRLEGGVMTDLGGEFAESHAYAINAAGQVAGEVSTTGGGGPQAALFSGDQTTVLGTLGGPFSRAYGLNDAGQIVGEAVTARGDYHAALWSEGEIRDLGTLGGGDSQARAINAAGQVVGWSHRTDGASPHAFLYNDGRMIDLGTLAGFSGSWATGINAQGQVVGFAGVVNDQLGTFTQHAFLVADGVMTDLNTLIPPDTGWTLTVADAINDAGQIVGAGLIGGEKHAFLLTPVPPTPTPIPEPTTLALLGSVAAVSGARIGLSRRRRGGPGGTPL